MSTDSEDPLVVSLPYSIAGSSEHSGRYVADNIRVNSPHDQSSRWSGAHQGSNVKQWLLIRLDDLAVIKSVTFGKFHKPHPCNMKEFRLYVGLSDENMTEVLHAGLKNDTVAETFAVRSVNQAGLTFPSRFVKIEPLSAHGHSFHTSIWYVALNGINDERHVSHVNAKHEEYRETVVLRLVLKHLRQRRILGPLNDILGSTGFQLEYPSVTKLYEALVLQGDFTLCESLLQTIADTSLFTSSLLSSQLQTQWTRLDAVDADGDAPSPRSGHAMCIDCGRGTIYLFGGWDGRKNLDDFWAYDIRTEKWRVLSYATQRELHGPSPRACHKIVLDENTGDIYFFGRLDDPCARELEVSASGTESQTSGTSAPLATPVSPPPPAATASGSRILPPPPWSQYAAEFFRYHTRGPDEGKWEILTPDATANGGPQLVFDEQMCIDTDNQMIYISGGRIIDGDWDTFRYSGLFSYNIRTREWDAFQTSDPSGSQPSIPGRFGHSMLLDHHSQTLFILGGQRDEKYKADMYAFHIPTNTVTELFSNYYKAGGPEPGFTQRAVIDPDMREIYMFCGLTRKTQGSQTTVERDAPYWVYRYERADKPGRWTKMSPSDVASFDDSESTPAPRYAHQVVYDHITKTTYLHGGNGSLDEQIDDRVIDGGSGDMRSEEAAETTERIEDVAGVRDSRLDDFWKMTLIRPSSDDIVRRGRYLIRQQHFRELCEDADPLKALSYLQTDVSAVVDHTDAEETRLFRSLLSHLLSPQGALGSSSMPTAKKRSREESPVRKDDDKVADDDDPMFSRPHSPVRTTSSLTTSESASIVGSRPLLSYVPDPSERKINEGNAPSAARFKQRTQVFEELMEYVNDDAKQPDKDLMLMINVDQEDP